MPVDVAGMKRSGKANGLIEREGTVKDRTDGQEGACFSP